MLEALKEQVCEANLELVRQGVVLYTWGNASGIDRNSGIMAIKPSGVSYDGMSPKDMVLVDVESGEVAEGNLRPSSDTPTHLILYRSFPEIGGVVHAHSAHACAFAQAGMPLPALGTTHADHFFGEVPCTRQLTSQEVREAYEANTGRVIVEAFDGRDPLAVPAALVRGHGPFAWGKDVAKAAYHAVVLEEVARMACLTLALNPTATLERYVLEKHYLRKHGLYAYYGQGDSQDVVVG